MKATLNKIPSIHGSVMKTGEKDKRLICFLSFSHRTTDGAESKMYLTLPYVVIAHEKHLRELERAVCKVFGKKELDDCVGCEVDARWTNIPTSILGSEPTTEIIALHKDGQELFVNDWCTKTFGVMFKTGLETRIKREQEQLDALASFHTARIRHWNEVLK